MHITWTFVFSPVPLSLFLTSFFFFFLFFPFFPFLFFFCFCFLLYFAHMAILRVLVNLAGTVLGFFEQFSIKRGEGNANAVFHASQTALQVCKTTQALTMYTPGGGGIQYTQEQLYEQQQIDDDLMDVLLNLYVESLTPTSTGGIFNHLDATVAAILQQGGCCSEEEQDDPEVEQGIQQLKELLLKKIANSSTDGKAVALQAAVVKRIDDETANNANMKLFLKRRATLLNVLGLYQMFVALHIEAPAVYRMLCKEKKTAPSIAPSVNRYLYRCMNRYPIRLTLSWPSEYVGPSLSAIYRKALLEMAMDKVRLLDQALCDSSRRYLQEYENEVRLLQQEKTTLAKLEEAAKKIRQPRQSYFAMKALIRQLMRTSMNFSLAAATTKQEFQYFTDQILQEIAIIDANNRKQGLETEGSHVVRVKAGKGKPLQRLLPAGMFVAARTQTGTSSSNTSRGQQQGNHTRGLLELAPISPGVTQRIPTASLIWASGTGCSVQTSSIRGDAKSGEYNGIKYKMDVAKTHGRDIANKVENGPGHLSTRVEARYLTGCDRCAVCGGAVGKEMHQEGHCHLVTREYVCSTCFYSSLAASVVGENSRDGVGELIQARHCPCHRCGIAPSTTKYTNNDVHATLHEHQFCALCEQALVEKSRHSILKNNDGTCVHVPVESDRGTVPACPICNRLPGEPGAVLALVYSVFITSRASKYLGLTPVQQDLGEDAENTFQTSRQNKNGNAAITSEKITLSCFQVMKKAREVRAQMETALTQTVANGAQQNDNAMALFQEELWFNARRWYQKIAGAIRATILLEAAQHHVVGCGSGLTLHERRRRQEQNETTPTGIARHLLQTRLRPLQKEKMFDALGIATFNNVTMDDLERFANDGKHDDVITSTLIKTVVSVSKTVYQRFPLNPLFSCAVEQLKAQSSQGAGFTMTQSLHMGLALAVVPPLLVRLFLLLSTPSEWEECALIKKMAGTVTMFKEMGATSKGNSRTGRTTAIPSNGVKMEHFVLADEDDVKALVRLLERTDLKRALFFAAPTNHDSKSLRAWRRAFVNFVWDINVNWKSTWFLFSRVSVGRLMTL